MRNGHCDCLGDLFAMRKLVTTFACAVLTLLATSAHAAGGINLSWTDCGVSGQLQRNFACNSNSGTNTMVASVVTGVAMNQFNGEASVMDLQTNQAALSPWWGMMAVGCRGTSVLSADFNFLAMSNCLDPWAGLAVGGVNYSPGFGAPNRARIRTVSAIPSSTAINGSDEYYLVKVAFSNARTTGLGSCPGCTDGACIVFNSVFVTQPAGVGNFTITSTLVRNWVQWQSGAAGICPGATPTRHSTWGQVKTLYR